jgi:hypothetical protein
MHSTATPKWAHHPLPGPRGWDLWWVLQIICSLSATGSPNSASLYPCICCSVCLPICLSIYLSIYLPLAIHLSPFCQSISTFLSFYLLSIYLAIICLSIHLSVLIFPIVQCYFFNTLTAQRLWRHMKKPPLSCPCVLGWCKSPAMASLNFLLL